MTDFMKDYQRGLLMNECTNFVPFGVALDVSGSMMNLLSSGKTRYQTAVEEFEQFLYKLAQNSTLAENVHLFLYCFGGDKVSCVVEGKALCDLNIPQLAQQLRAIPCGGSTPMGRCIVEMMDRLEEAKQVVSRAALNYAQPVLSIIGDGLPTDDLAEAKKRIYTAMEQQQQKLLLLPVGIGDPGTTFDVFDVLLGKDRTETPVLSNADDLKVYFKLLNKTVRSIEKGQFITPSTQFGLVRTIAENAAIASQREHANQGGDL